MTLCNWNFIHLFSNYFCCCPNNWIVYRNWEPYHFASVGFGDCEIRWWEEIEGEIGAESLKLQPGGVLVWLAQRESELAE